MFSVFSEQLSVPYSVSGRAMVNEFPEVGSGRYIVKYIAESDMDHDSGRLLS